MKQLGSHWMDFHEIWYLSIFRKSVKKIEVSLLSDKNNGTLREDKYTFVITSRRNSPSIEISFRQKLYRKSKHEFCSVTFLSFFPSFFLSFFLSFSKFVQFVR
jgi:hypothetical protein